MMEEILNLSKMALGQTNTYVSKGAQQNSVAYSSMGTAYLYDGFIHFIEKDMQYSINQQKMLYAQGKQEEMVRFMTSRAGQKFIKVTKDMRYEDVRIFLKVMDMVDTQARDRILSYAQAWSQNPTFMVDPIDILMLEREKTWTGMIRKLTYSMKKKKNEAMKQQQYQQMLEQVNAEKQQQAMLAQEGMRQSGANDRAMLQGQIKQDGDAMKHMQSATPQQASSQ
jgi:hypothetical protein